MPTPSGTSLPQETDAVADRLYSAAVHLLRRVRVPGEESGLSAPRLSALSSVVVAGPVTISALARIEGVRPPTMTRLVDGLERDGLVMREPHPDDGRSVQVRATGMGRLVLSRGRAHRTRDLASLLDPLSPEEVAILVEAIALIEGLGGAQRGSPRREQGLG